MKSATCNIGSRLLPLAAGVAAAFGLLGDLSAATLTVNTPSASSVPGKCSLADAVASINAGSAFGRGGCKNTGAPFGTADTIGFVKNYVISFSAPAANASSALVLRKPVAIVGNVDAKQTTVVLQRSATATSRFRVLEAGADLSLTRVTVASGSSPGDGGGVAMTNGAALGASGCVFSANAADGRGGAIFAEGDVTIDSSTVSGNSAALGGGGVYSEFGTVGIDRSTISGNDTAGFGGGVAAASLVGSASTISGNAAAVGGGVYASSPSTLTNTTVSGNSAIDAGGGIYASGTISLMFATVSANSVADGGMGAGLVTFFDGNAIQASILSGNSGGNDVDTFYVSRFSGDHDIVGSSGRSVTLPDDTLHCDPRLAPLMNDGGPTLTQPLMDGSCAVNAGPETSLPSDQRGDPRVVGSRADIGAVEKQGSNDPPAS